MNSSLCRSLIAGLLSLHLCGCGADGSVVSGSPGGEGAVPLARAVYGTVMTNDFVAQAKVEVLDDQGQQTFYTTTSDEGGGFTLPASTLLPRKGLVRVTASDGKVFEREIGNDPSSHLWINVLTTLVARLHREQPNLTLEQAEASLRSDLEIGAKVGFGGIPDSPGTPFSHSLFFQAASQRGYSAYLTEIVNQVKSGSAPAFAYPDDGVGFGFFSPKATSPKQLNESARDLLNLTEASILDPSPTSILGRICATAGLNLVNADVYRQSILDDDDMRERIGEFGAAAVPRTQGTDYQRLYGRLDVDSRSLGFAGLTLKILQLNQVNSVFEVDAPRRVPAEVNSFLRLLAEPEFEPRAIGQRCSEATLAEGDDNITLALGRSLNAPLGVTEPGRKFDDYELRSDWMGQKMRQCFAYCSGLTMWAGSHVLELATASYLPAPLDATTEHPVGPLKAARDYLLEQAMRLRRGSQFVTGRIGSDLVLIDMKPTPDGESSNRRTMWYLKADLKSYEEAKNYAEKFELSNWKGWRLPTFAELELLHSRIENVRGNRTSDKMKVLGFRGISNDYDNDRKYWYEGSRYSTTNYRGFTFYHNRYYNMRDGRAEEDPGASTNQSYTVLLVRSCPDFSTGDEDALAYINQIESLYDMSLVYLGDSQFRLFYTALIRDHNGQQKIVPVGDRALWTSSDRSICELIPIQGGTAAKFYSSAAVTLTAEFRGKTLSKEVRAATWQLATLRNLQITPRNVGYPTVPAAQQFQSFHCTKVFSDGKLTDSDQGVNWSLHTPEGLALPTSVATVNSGGTVTFGQAGFKEIRLRATDPDSGQTDEVKIGIVAP